MTLPVLRKIRDLVAAGAIVTGSKPVESPSLTDNETEFHTIANQVWGDRTDNAPAVHGFGKGKVYFGKTANEVLADLKLDRDFEYTRPAPDTKLMFTHRKLPDGDLYFVDNRNDRIENTDATFRVYGKAPELWHADTGKIEPASYHSANGRTTVPLRLNPYEAVFVVFRKPADGTSRSLPLPTEKPLTTVSGPWMVSFQPDRGVTGNITLNKLISWSESSNLGVKYFSGTATYTRTVHAQYEWFRPGTHLWLDLGNVKEIADITVNGNPLGIVWKAPYRIDVTGALKPGDNQLTIKVTNLWVNRLIGDQQSGTTKKVTFTTFKPYRPDSPLLPSGLLGPVKIISIANK